MSGENVLKASEKLSEHINQITAYIDLSNTKFSSFREEYLLTANLSSEDLKRLTQQETFDAADNMDGISTF